MSSINLFSLTYFDRMIAYGVWEWNDPHHIFFWTESYYLFTFWVWRNIFHRSHHISAFFAGIVRFQTLVLLFFCFYFSAFCKFQYHCYKKMFLLTFIIRVFYFALVWRRLKSIKLKKSIFFLPNSNKFAIQTNPFMQLWLIYHKTLIKPNEKPKNFKFIDLVIFSN